MAGNRWIRWDVGYFRNAKARSLGKDGRALHLASACWAADNLSDGFIPAHMLAMLCADAEVKPAIADTLVRVGVWKPQPDGWQLHDFLVHNKSRADVEHERDKWSRKKAGQRGMSPGDTAGDSPGDSAVCPPTETDVTRRDVRSAGIQSQTDRLPGPAPSSSFSAEQTVAHQLARHQAAATVPDDIRRWLPATRKGIMAERHDDIVHALAAAGGDAEQALNALLAQGGSGQPTALREAWYADPNCSTCGGDGLDPVGGNAFAPCPCRRPDPYPTDLATIHHLPGATA